MKLRCVADPEGLDRLVDAGFEIDEVSEFPNMHPWKLSGVVLRIPVGTTIWRVQGAVYVKPPSGVRFRMIDGKGGRRIEAV